MKFFGLRKGDPGASIGDEVFAPAGPLLLHTGHSQF